MMRLMLRGTSTRGQTMHLIYDTRCCCTYIGGTASRDSWVLPAHYATRWGLLNCAHYPVTLRGYHTVGCGGPPDRWPCEEQE